MATRIFPIDVFGTRQAHNVKQENELPTPDYNRARDAHGLNRDRNRRLLSA